LYAQTFTKSMTVLPAAARRAAAIAFGMVNLQAALGISALLYLVPVPIAAGHQAGSVMLITAVIHILLALRKPGTAARAWKTLSQNPVLAKS
jgi:cytochrome c oxidase assembly protein subunit 15